MRNLIIALLLFSLTGCTEKYTDSRPADQVSFINFTREWRDTVNLADGNEALRRQLLEQGVNVVKTHISDTLQLQFQSWEARVLDIAADPTDRNYTITSLGMNLDGGVPNEKTRYESIVLTSRTSGSDAISAALKGLGTGDLVRIDGTFKTMRNTIDIDSYNDLSKSKNVLDNPEFGVEISKIEKF